MSTQVSKVCDDCSESYMVSIHAKHCRICGQNLRALTIASDIDNATTNDEPNNLPIIQPRNNESLFGTFADLLNSDIMQQIQTSLSQTRSKKLSSSFIKTLGKIIVDQKSLILYDIILQIGSLRITVIPAIFSILPISDSISGHLIAANPIYGDFNLAPLRNSDVCNNGFVYMKRGEISFVQKAIIAQRSGAKCVIISQSYDTWPFMMTDSISELDSLLEPLQIPVVMVSNSDGKHIETLLSKLNSSDSTSLQCILKTNLDKERQCECAICQENMIPTNEVLKLPCGHVYHSHCIFSWLDIHSSCPLCRERVGGESSDSTVGNNDGDEAMGRALTQVLGGVSNNGDTERSQSYFV